MTVINKDYLKLEEQIQKLQANWSKQVEDSQVADIQHISSFTQYPVLPQISVKIDSDKYKSFIIELSSLLKDLQSNLETDLQKLEDALTTEALNDWAQEGINVNEEFFVKFAESLQIASWIPQFMAEHALRPYLHKVSSELKETLKGERFAGCCPVCGEAPRLAKVSKDGKKEMVCPRCQYTWNMKKIQCAHCGTDDHKQIEIIKIEKSETGEIHVCNSCKGYTKLIDTRQLIKQDPVALLDLKTLHLDFIAQDKGYGMIELEKEVH